ncbi:YceD family protein [Haliangium sp.]|uniref:YceD family protein n=1 Tax=Haliangium sp. TaxID=2663208 RepID=UPI003D1118C3
MSADTHMIVQLRELPAHREIELGAGFVRETLAGMPMRDALERPADDPDAGAAQAALDLYQEGDNVFVRGRLQGWFEVACSRCVGPARIELDEQLAVTYLPKAHLPEDEGEGADPATAGEEVEGEVEAEHTDDDLDLYGYEGEAVDLTLLFRDQIILAVPFAPLCHEDCKGLCPQCGVDRNHESCDCQPPLDPRLAALRNIEL